MSMLKKLISLFKKSPAEPPVDEALLPQPLYPSPMVGELHGLPDRR
jgi:hypothetical protein